MDKKAPGILGVPGIYTLGLPSKNLPENGLGRKANSLPKLKESEAYYIPKCDCGRETVCVFSIKHSLFLAGNHILSLVQI